MAKYKCLNCRYSGDEFDFQFTDYTYCIASNEVEPEFINSCPEWVSNKLFGGSAEIGEPVGCPKCNEWDVTNFELVE